MSHDAIMVMSTIYGFIGILTATVQLDKKRSNSAAIYALLLWPTLLLWALGRGAKELFKP